MRVITQQTLGGPVERVVDAHRVLDRGHLQGKLVLTV